MKKQFLAIAIAAGLATPFMASAEATVYGRAHVSFDNVETGGGTPVAGSPAALDCALAAAPGFLPAHYPKITCKDAEMDLSDRKSAFGVKAKEDLGGGLTAMAKFEWSVNPTDTNSAIGVRDRWVGLKKAGMGTVKFGTMSNNYKETAAKMDPFWHTAFEGRATLGYSDLSNASGDDGGRMSNLLQFSSAPMGGMQVVVNAQLNGTGEMTTGLGVRYESKGLYVFLDTLKIENDADGDGISDHRDYVAGESATKFGVKYTTGGLTAGIAVEQTADVTASSKDAGDGYDFTFLMASYKIGDNDSVAFSYGMAADDTVEFFDKDTVTVGYTHGMSKRTSVYALFSSGSSDFELIEHSGLSLGLKHSF